MRNAAGRGERTVAGNEHIDLKGQDWGNTLHTMIPHA